MYTRVARTVLIVTSARVRTLSTNVVNFECSGRRDDVRPREDDAVGRPMA